MIATILITVSLILGATIVTQEDMALHSVRVWAENKNSKWFEPLILCEWCMPSIWSVFGFIFSCLIGYVDFDIIKIILMYPIVACSSSFIVGFSWLLFDIINVKRKHLKNIEQMSYWDLSDRKKRYKQKFNSEG